MADVPSDPGAPRPDDDDDEPRWVTTLVSAAGALGFNRVRLRWKLRAWIRRRRADRNRVAQKVTAVRYQHRVCNHCGALNDRGDSTCQRCHQTLSLRAVEIARRVGVPIPRGTPTTLLAAALLAVFVAAVIAQTAGTALELDPRALIVHGANYPGSADPVRDLTSLLVHGGAFHLLIGMFTLVMVGGLLERELSPALVIWVFLISGGGGAAASDAFGRDGLGLGAAGGVLGLIGAGAMIGQRAGTRRGRTYRNELLSVGVLVVGFGLFGHQDHAALIPALLIGALLGWLLPRLALDERFWLARVVGAVGVAGLIALTTVAAAGWLPVPARYARAGLMIVDGNLVEVPDDVPDRDPPYADRYMAWSRDPGDADDVATSYVVCEALTRQDGEVIDMFGGPATARAICGRRDALRQACVDIEATLAGVTDQRARDLWRPALTQDCTTVREIDAMLARDPVR
jgi:membrane associated rhomboid family serine protease